MADNFAAQRWARERNPNDALRMIAGPAWSRVSLGNVNEMNADYDYGLSVRSIQRS